MSEVVLTEDRGRTRVLTLNRPRAKNAFNDELYDDLADALRLAAKDAGVAVVVLTGAEGAFSAGQDLSELGRPRHYDDGKAHGFPPFVDVLQEFPKPLIAAVNGVAVGIGVTLLLHCDLVFVAEGARLRAPFVSLGIPTEAGSSALFPDRIGWQNTAWLLFTSPFIDADKAVEMGLAWKKSGVDALMTDVMAVADEIAAMPIATLMDNKRLLIDARIDAVKAARPREEAAIARMAGSPANREAVAAFMQKRKPDFTGM